LKELTELLRPPSLTEEKAPAKSGGRRKKKKRKSGRGKGNGNGGKC